MLLPKVSKRKVCVQSTRPIKTVNLYGKPNREKYNILKKTQQEYNNALNVYIGLLLSNKNVIFEELVNNNYKNLKVSAIERDNKYGLNSKLSQNAFFEAFTKLSNREKSIKAEVSRFIDDFLIISSTVYVGLLQDKSKEDILSDICNYLTNSITAFFNAKKKTKSKINFYKKIRRLLLTNDIEDLRTEVKFWYDSASLEFKIPEFKNAPVKLDTALCSFVESNDIKAPYVITISNPFEKGKRYDVPLNTTQRNINRLNIYKNATSFNVRVKDNGIIHVMASVKKDIEFEKEFDTINGVDTGINDIFYVSNGKHFGSFNELIDFYKTKVEPKEAEKTNLRNKKRKIKHFLQKHKNLPEKVKAQLIKKMYNLQKMIQQNKVADRKNNEYHQKLNLIIKKVINNYCKTITKSTLTVLELLDIKEFDKSKKANGMLSVFARGLVQKRLMEHLTWHGYSYKEVDPTYTSQVCPVCFNLDKNNRNAQSFNCTCCGFKGNADHVGGINIGERAIDKKINAIISRCHTHKETAEALRKYYIDKHNKWLNAAQAA